MADLNELRERIEAALPCEEYERQHPGDFDDAAYGNAAEHAAKILLGVASRDPVVFKTALDNFREQPSW